jgi:aspartyl protease family protein
MRQILLAFVFMAAAALGLARYVDQSAKSSAASSAANAMTVNAKPAPPPAGPPSYRTVTLQNDGSGQFRVEARVDGRPVNFLVDTGASAIVLNEKSAAWLGIHPAARDYTVRMQTANGVGKAARVRLNQIEVNGITVRDLDALVVADESLSTNLLGMSFLSRVKWTHDRGRLVLEQ